MLPTLCHILLSSLIPYVLQWSVFSITKGFADLVQYVEPFCYYSEYCVDTIQVINVFPEGDEELRRNEGEKRTRKHPISWLMSKLRIWFIYKWGSICKTFIQIIMYQNFPIEINHHCIFNLWLHNWTKKQNIKVRFLKHVLFFAVQVHFSPIYPYNTKLERFPDLFCRFQNDIERNIF